MNSARSEMPRARRIALLAGAVATVVVFAVGVFQLVTGHDSARRLDRAGAAAPASHPPSSPADDASTTMSAARGEMAVPSREVRGVLTGYPHTVAGARAAAVGWIAATAEWIEMGPVGLPETVREIAAAAEADRLAAQFESNRAELTDTLGGDPSRLVWIEAPLRVVAHRYAGRPEAMQVEVWSVLMIGNPERPGTVDALFRTHVIELAWERSDWRLVSSVEREGPTPALAPGRLPSDVSEFAALVDWTPATRAGVG